MLRAVLFDLDDTLIDHQGAADAAVTAWAAEHGIAGEDVPARWKAVSDVHYGRYQRRELTAAEQRRARVREFLGVDVSDARADDLFAGYWGRYEAGWAPFSDAGPALRRARAAGLRAVVFTNGDEGQQILKLRRAGLEAEADLLVASSSLAAGKPDPRAFAGALARAGVAAAEALMVGDNLVNDVLGAGAAGVGAVLLDRYGAHPVPAARRITSLDELDFTPDGP